MPISPPGDTTPAQTARDWLDHIAQGRIATKTGTTAAQRARHVRNEIALLGRIL